MSSSRERDRQCPLGGKIDDEPRIARQVRLLHEHPSRLHLAERAHQPIGHVVVRERETAAPVPLAEDPTVLTAFTSASASARSRSPVVSMIMVPTYDELPVCSYRV
jgi:hypothetical protein